MNIITKYIFSKITNNILIVYGGFIGLLFIIQTVRMLKYIPASAIKLNYIINFGLLLLPGSLFAINSVIMSIVIYISYYSMIQNNELTALKSSGFNKKTIITPSIYILFINFIILLIITFFISPWTNKKFDKAIMDIKDGYILSVLKAGEVIKFNNISIYYKEIEGNSMKDFTILKTSKDSEFSEYYSLYSQYADIENSLDGAYLVLIKSQIAKIIISNANTEDISKNINNSDITKIKLSTILQKNEKNKTEIYEKNMSLGHLLSLNTEASRKEIHKRIITSYYSIFASFILVLGILNIKNNRNKNHKELNLSLLFCFIFIILSFILPKSALQNINFIKLYTIYTLPLISIFVFNKYLEKL